MSREQSLRNGAGLMVLGALIFLVYAVVFFLRAFASSGFEIGVETLNGVTPQQLDGLNPAIMGYIAHLHVAIAGFIAATAIAAGGLAWYGVRDGLWWAWIIAVVVPVVGLAVALPMHYMGHFNYDWLSHLGPIYLGTIIYVVGAVVALVGLTQGAPAAAQARRKVQQRVAARQFGPPGMHRARIDGFMAFPWKSVRRRIAPVDAADVLKS